MDVEFCVEALKEALAKHDTPEIFNTDQGTQFTSGGWIDNRMVERLWRSLKYECVYLDAFEKGSEAKAGIGKWLIYDNAAKEAVGCGEQPQEARLRFCPEAGSRCF